MNFWIGQRVKLVKPVHAVNEGLEGLIVDWKSWPKGTLNVFGKRYSIDVDCLIRWDGCPGLWAQHTSQLEPILPEGLEAPERIAELWEPSPEVVKS